MSGGSLPVRTGSYESDGNALTVDNVGFRPKRVRFVNEGTGAEAEWQDTMPDDSVRTHDSGTDAFATSDGVTPQEDGFAVGTNAVVNTSGEVVHWTAWA